MVDVLRSLTQKDILPSVAPTESTQPRLKMFHLPAFASSWEEDKREQDASWTERLAQLASHTDRILDSVLSGSEHIATTTSAAISVAEKLKGASSPTSDDWNEFAAQTPEERSKIIAGWQNLEAALA